MPNSLRCKIKHLCHNGTLTERERDRIFKALEQEPKWIPVSERLPEEREWYLTVFKEIDTGYQLISRVADYIGNGENAWRIIDEDSLGQEYCSTLECVAWMPLPKPYKESEENDDIENMLEHLWNDTVDEESEVEECH